jgi:hypothetical protein
MCIGHSPRHGELEVRPIRHRLPDRVRAQVFLRMLSCYLGWYLNKSSRRSCFTTTTNPARPPNAAIPFVAAQRFNPALAKASRKRTADHYPGTASPACSPTWPPSAPTMFSPPTTCQRSP